MTDHNPMEIDVRDQGEISIVDVHGRLAIGESAEQLHEALNTIVRRGVRKVVVILNHVTQIDSSGISTLVRVAIGRAREKGSLHWVGGPGRRPSAGSLFREPGRWLRGPAWRCRSCQSV